MDNTDFLSKQIITYMGNKRKFVPIIDDIITKIESRVGRKLKIGEGFSGSGILSRLFKTRAKTLYVNDIAGYSTTLNNCYLSTFTAKEKREIEKLISQANACADDPNSPYDPWISNHWSSCKFTNKTQDRMYFTHDNGVRIDKYRKFIDSIKPKYRDVLLAILLVKCSIHNNTNGQFSAYFKEDFGGKNNVDVKRITKKIVLDFPVLNNKKCNVRVSQLDANYWVQNIPKLDLVYYDPPYNKHPYSIYYFMLDIINNWDISKEIPNSYRGQPKDWYKSKYNSIRGAETSFRELISNTNSRFIVISYNDGGIIPIDRIDKLLDEFGIVEKMPINHNVYNRYKGIGNYKRKNENKAVKEYLWILEKENQ